MNKEEPSLPNIVVSAVAVTGGLVIMVIIAAIAYLPNRPDTVARPGMSPEERRAILQEKQDRERTELAEYGWINRNEGWVRLPIERAMELAVEEIEERGTIVVEDFDVPEDTDDAADEDETPAANGDPGENDEAEGEEPEEDNGEENENQDGNEGGATTDNG